MLHQGHLRLPGCFFFMLNPWVVLDKPKNLNVYEWGVVVGSRQEYFTNCWSAGTFSQLSLWFKENGPKKEVQSAADGDSKVTVILHLGTRRADHSLGKQCFSVCSKMLSIFYHSAVASDLFFAVVCWGSSFGARDTNRLSKKPGSTISRKQHTFEDLVERTLNKLLSLTIWTFLSAKSWKKSGAVC